VLQANMDEKKRLYHSAFQSLKETKSEIERVQRVFEAGRVRMHSDFESWYTNCLLRARSTGGPAPAATPSLAAAAPLPLTASASFGAAGGSGLPTTAPRRAASSSPSSAAALQASPLIAGGSSGATLPPLSHAGAAAAAAAAVAPPAGVGIVGSAVPRAHLAVPHMPPSMPAAAAPTTGNRCVVTMGRIVCGVAGGVRCC
jgi:hypothetical protein